MIFTKKAKGHTTEELLSITSYEDSGWMKFMVNWGMILAAVYCIIAGLLPFTYDSYYVSRVDVWTMHQIFPVMIPVTRMVGTVLLIAAALLIITRVQLAGFSSIAPKLMSVCFYTILIVSVVYIGVLCLLFFTEDALTYEILKADSLINEYVGAWPYAYTGETSVFEYQSSFSPEQLKAFLEANQFADIPSAVAVFDKVEAAIQLLADAKGQEVANNVVNVYVQNCINPGSVEVTEEILRLRLMQLQVSDAELLQWNAVKDLQVANFGDAFKLMISCVSVELIGAVMAAVLAFFNSRFMKKASRLFVK